MVSDTLICGDSLQVMNCFEDESIHLIYLDPPFYTQETQKLTSRNSHKEYSFQDIWKDMDEYLGYMEERFLQCRRILKDTGSIFVHCDRNASHYLKVLMDKIFGIQNFQSEIVWYYKRWSNSKRGLLNNHQMILFYSKTGKFKFNKIYTDYSVTTNIDQILQERVRDEHGKSVYKKDSNGNVIIGEEKKGVPLSDVWEIPFLNPKAKERVGYPTQKPIILLEQIIKLVTDENDIVLDPFMGSGTTAVAAKLLNRHYIGIDILNDAVELAQARLEKLVRTDSQLLNKGKAAYLNLSEKQMNLLKSMNAVPVQRNSGIDGFLKNYIDEKPVAVRIQRENETLSDTIAKLQRSAQSKACKYMIIVRTHMDKAVFCNYENIPDDILIIDEYDWQIKQQIDNKYQQKKKLSVAISG